VEGHTQSLEQARLEREHAWNVCRETRRLCDSTSRMGPMG
jgi:hypothetical protein